MIEWASNELFRELYHSIIITTKISVIITYIPVFKTGILNKNCL